jgi:hypothetical protein
MKRAILVWTGLIIFGCANVNCREARDAQAAASGTTAAAPASEVSKEKDPMSKTSAADRVKVYKPDGSLQCGQGKAIPLETMQKQLGKIKVYNSFNKNDGMMRIQVCGQPTGMSNVYEIDRKDLAAAQKAGFKEWTNE